MSIPISVSRYTVPLEPMQKRKGGPNSPTIQKLNALLMVTLSLLLYSAKAGRRYTCACITSGGLTPEGSLWLTPCLHSHRALHFLKLTFNTAGDIPEKSSWDEAAILASLNMSSPVVSMQGEHVSEIWDYCDNQGIIKS